MNFSGIFSVIKVWTFSENVLEFSRSVAEVSSLGFAYGLKHNGFA